MRAPSSIGAPYSLDVLYTPSGVLSRMSKARHLRSMCFTMVRPPLIEGRLTPLFCFNIPLDASFLINKEALCHINQMPNDVNSTSF